MLFCPTTTYELLLSLVKKKISPKMCKCLYVYDYFEEQLDSHEI